MDKIHIKIFDDYDEESLIKKLETGDFNGACQVVDKILSGANNDNIKEYSYRIWGIVHCIIKCGYFLSDTETRFMLIDKVKEDAPFDVQYNRILINIQKICSNASLNYADDDKSFVQNIENYIAENYSLNTLNITAISAAMQYSPTHLNRKFNELKHVTISKYLLHYRIEKAKKFILLPNLKTNSIVSKCGFSSVRTFNRTFNEIVGMSPREYKKLKMAESINNKEIHKNKFKTPSDYGIGICNSIMHQYDARYLPPCVFIHSHQVSVFTYQQGTLLKGMLNVYSSYSDENYIKYVQKWVDSTIDENMQIYIPPNWGNFNSLDYRQPGILLFSLYDYTHDSKYLDIANQLVGTLNDYPKNEYGGYFHNLDSENQMWLGDSYTLVPTCIMYSKYTGIEEYADTAILQLEIMWEHMRDENGLLHHGWDPTKKALWADSKTGLSPVVWGRALGFYLTTVIDVIDYLDESHSKRPVLIDIFKTLISTVVTYQSKTGGWYQILDKPNLTGNWTETSATCFIVYAIAKAYRLGIISDSYMDNIKKGYNATLEMIDFSKNGYLIVKNTSTGMSVSTQDKYLIEKIAINDMHGIAAFATMCGELMKIDIKKKWDRLVVS